MAFDLTPSFKAAKERSTDWGLAAASGIMNAIALMIPNSVVDWEPGDEEWGRVLVGQKVRGLVHARMPLAFLVTPVAVPEDPSLSEVVIVRVERTDTRSFRIDKDWLESILGRPLTDNVDYEALSLDDLWWATVS